MIKNWFLYQKLELTFTELFYKSHDKIGTKKKKSLNRICLTTEVWFSRNFVHTISNFNLKFISFIHFFSSFARIKLISSYEEKQQQRKFLLSHRHWSLLCISGRRGALLALEFWLAECEGDVTIPDHVLKKQETI